MSKIYSLVLNSKDRNSGSLNNPSFVLKEQIMDINGVKVKSALIPISNYTFDSRNNKIYFTEETTANVATITPGIYTSTNITGAIVSALDSVGSFVYDSSYFSTTNNLSISTTGGNFSLQTGANMANYELGIGENDLNVSNTICNLSLPIDLSGLKQVNVVSNIGASEVHNQQYKVLASIPMNEQQNAITYYSDNSNDYIYTDIKNLSDINMKLFDDRFREITPLKDFQIQINFLTDKINHY